MEEEIEIPEFLRRNVENDVPRYKTKEVGMAINPDDYGRRQSPSLQDVEDDVETAIRDLAGKNTVKARAAVVRDWHQPENTPIYTAAVAVSSLVTYDSMRMAKEVITGSEALKDIPAHELSIALANWGTRYRFKAGEKVEYHESTQSDPGIDIRSATYAREHSKPDPSSAQLKEGLQ
jgi:hypothetical protein